MNTAEVRSIRNYIKPRVPRAGKIRLGVKTDKGYPREVDYFVMDGDLPHRERIVSLYGVQPKRLLVTFLSDDPEDIFPIAYKAYGRGLGLVCKGNGESAQHAVIDRDDKGQAIRRDSQGKPVTQQRECPCEMLPKQCKAMGNLLVVLPEIGVEHYQIDTSSWHAHQNIRNDLRHFSEMFSDGEGGFRGRLFWLERVPQETHGSGRKETHYPMRLTLPTPQEYAEKLKDIGGFISQYRSLLAALPSGEYETPAALPHGSPVEEEDLVVDDDMVKDATFAPTIDRDALIADLHTDESIRGLVIQAAKDLGYEGSLRSLMDDQLVTLRDRVFDTIATGGGI